MSATHIHTATEPSAAPSSAGPWLTLSASLTEQVPALAGRDDLMVTCAPGAGRGAPGCFLPALATVELDGDHLGTDPATCDPSRPSDRERYPALWGVLVHEAAHAARTAWNPPTTDPTAHVRAALMLEESRIEAAQLGRRPADRHWLRAAATQLVLADFTTDPTPSSAPQAPMTPWDAARAAALLLARVDAGVLDDDETTVLAATVTGVLGAGRLEALRKIWQEAHATADTDSATMLELGRRWCQTLDVNPDQHPPSPGTDSTKDETSGGAPGEPGETSPLAEAIAGTLASVQASDHPSTSDSSRSKKRAAERAARQQAQKAARRVFSETPITHDEPAHRRRKARITGTRQPTADERAAARRLARTFRAAAHRERTATTITSPRPPGRLRMRDALAADAQRAAGAVPTAEPFSRTVRRHVPAPPLRLGIACDVSGSMRSLARPVASAAWLLARAAAHIPDARSATVLFGERVQPLTYPGRVPSGVREFVALDLTEQFCEAVDALDATLELTRPDAARLLVVVSDGRFTADQRTNGTRRIARLTNTGCAVLWLALDSRAVPLKGTHALTLTNPADAAPAIATAAARALREAV